MLKSTKKHTKYWKNRKIDWGESYFATKDHPHRKLLSWMLRSIDFYSLWEVGVGGGANLARFIEDLPGKQYGGCDVSESAIEFCRKTFIGGLFHVDAGNDLMMSDRSVDVILSDMMLIYVSPKDIDSYLREFRRVSRNYIVLCEFHSNDWWKRLKARFGGYHVHDYRKLLEKHGFYDIHIQHIPEQFWPGTDKNTEFRSIISAKLP